MEGGTIGGDVATSANTAMFGGGMYVSSGTFKMSGTAAIKGNEAKNSGGDVYVRNGGTANLVVDNNITSNIPDDVYREP